MEPNDKNAPIERKNNNNLAEIIVKETTELWEEEYKERLSEKDEKIRSLEKELSDQKKEEKLLSEISAVYLLNKKRFIEAEEYLPDMKLFVAPLLEHRDALDHIMRYYELQKKNESSDKCIKELENALGHEYRAFFDVADFICIKTRMYISDSIKKYSLKKILKAWPEYREIREEIVSISERIAQIRSTRKASRELVDKYEDVLNRIWSIYKNYLLVIEPRLYK